METNLELVTGDERLGSSTGHRGSARGQIRDNCLKFVSRVTVHGLDPLSFVQSIQHPSSLVQIPSNSGVEFNCIAAMQGAHHALYTSNLTNAAASERTPSQLYRAVGIQLYSSAPIWNNIHYFVIHIHSSCH